MGLFCSKKELKEMKENLQKTKNYLVSANLKIVSLKKEISRIKKEQLKYKEIVANDDKTIICLNEKLEQKKKEVKLLAARSGGQKTQFLVLKKKYQCELMKASKIIKDLESENKRLKSRPSLEALKLEKVSVSHENRKKLKK